MFACEATERVSTEIDDELLRTADRGLKTSELLAGCMGPTNDELVPKYSFRNLHCNLSSILAAIYLIDGWMDGYMCVSCVAYARVTHMSPDKQEQDRMIHQS